MSCVLIGIISLQFILISILLHEKFYFQFLTGSGNTSEVQKENPLTDGALREIPLDFSTSVFCTGNKKQERECRFSNLCYDPESEAFLFFHGNYTKQYGLPNTTLRSPLLDLTSVDDHNAKYFTYTNVQRQSYGSRKMHFVSGNSILFHRFNPENLMHVIHDDLLPHFHTKRKYYSSRNVTTIMLDGRDKGPFFDLYQLFMDRIVTKDMLNELTCFEDVVVGVSKVTTWYQYGFKEPQGPINDEKHEFPVEELFYFREHFHTRLGITHHSERKRERGIVLFTRQVSRRIINEMQLVLKLSTHFKLTVTTLDLQVDQLRDIIEHVSNARYLIGVHGAHLVTSIFLQPDSTLVEIFPFGVPSDNYTPYKTLAHILKISYVAWENKNEKDSISHTDRPAHFGGISELTAEMQQKIVETKTVPKHLCCKDPFWLYRIYQDTRVEIKDFINRIESFPVSETLESVSRMRPFFYPNKVTNLSCRFNKHGQTLEVSWFPPWNVLWAESSQLSYEVLLQTSPLESGSINKLMSVEGQTSLSVSVDSVVDLNIFVRCNLDGVYSEFLLSEPCS